MTNLFHTLQQGLYHQVTYDFIKKWDQGFLFEILENISDAVMINDSETRIVYVNKAYEEILKIPAHKAIGKKILDIEPDATAIQVMQTGKASHNIVDDLKTVNIQAVGMSFPLYKNKNIMGAVSIFNDVTELMKLTEELNRTKEISRYFQKQLDKSNRLPRGFDQYVGANTSVREMLFLASKVAKTESTVLIRGESGVGKEVLARSVHAESKRCKMPLIKVNCASIPEHLLESELFGYEEGAFTGARKGGKIGKFELAQGGTIFLDEIGDMTFNMQAKVLRVIQERELERVGGTKSVKLDIRIIAATNRDLEAMIADGTFRSDLYYRLNVIPLHIPSLRERKDDVLILSRFILNQLNNEAEQVGLSNDVMIILQQYDWPGNIRELQNVLEHANIVRTSNHIQYKDLPRYLQCAQIEAENVSLPCFGNLNLKQSIEIVEKELIMASLHRNNDNKSKCILELGISRRAFYEKLQKYGIGNVKS